MITNLMYNDEAGFFDGLYGQANPDMTNFEHWGHFSQIVWKDTTEVGCATVMCDSLGGSGTSGPIPFTVCNYSPPGTWAEARRATFGFLCDLLTYGLYRQLWWRVCGERRHPSGTTFLFCCHVRPSTTWCVNVNLFTGCVLDLISIQGVKE